jgi:hypothetical protein
MKAQALLVVLVVLLTSASCGSDDTTCTFPIEFVIAEGSTLTYVSGDTRVEWTAGDHVILDVIADTLRVNGFVYYPTAHPRRFFSEARLQQLYGDVPFVKAKAESLKNEEFPWRVASRIFGEQRVRIARAAREEFVRTRSIEAAKAVLLESSLISRVEVKMYGDLPVLEYWFEGLNIGDPPVPTVLELREWIKQMPERRAPFDPKVACSVARTLSNQLTDSRVARTIILRGGGLEVHGSAVSRSD